MVVFLYLMLVASLPSAVLALGLSRLRGTTQLVHFVGVTGPVITALCALVTSYHTFHNAPVIEWGGLFYLDGLSALMLLVLAMVTLLAVTYSVPYMNRELSEGKIKPAKLGWYYFWLGILIPAMYATVIFNSIGITWVLVEATTLASAPLVGFYGKEQSLEATWKYIVIATVGISFALLGILLTYAALMSNGSEISASLDWTYLLVNSGKLDPSLMKLAFIFILIGYGTKTGLVPMHTWLPDAHSQAPSPISALLSGALLNCALYGILRFNVLATNAIGSGYTSTLLIIFGLISVGTVIPFIINQDDLKRLLAYSSIEHMGIIVLAVGFGGEIGTFAAALHIFNHAVAKSFMFCVAGEVTARYHTREMKQIRGVISSTPFLGLMLFVGVLAITGVPPFNVFISEFLVIIAAFSTGNYLAAGLFLLFLSIIFASLIHHVSGMAFGRPRQQASSPATDSIDNHAEEKQVPVRLKPTLPDKLALFVFVTPALMLLLFGLWVPWLLQDLAQMAGTVLK